MASGYPFHDIESKWQAEWEASGVYHAKDLSASKKDQKFYGLIEFPYPSGEGLHVGHPRSYTAIDIMTRKRRMEGKDVLYPIGWDAFGLPTENFAIKHKIKPADATKKNVGNFTRQLKSLGFGFDWSREINTTDPKYYKWTQWMFLKFFNSYFDDVEGRAIPIDELAIPDHIQSQGEAAVRAYVDSKRMAYKGESVINWCPRCKIGLANEEAQGGVCERCGNPVEERKKAQWMIRITKYADRLVDDLANIDYLDKIKAQQINWIGRSEGAYVDFAVTIEKRGLLPDKLTVFTTRPDTLFGATYLVLAPEHPLVATWLNEGDITNVQEVRSYQEGTKLKSDLERQENKEKTGAELKGVSAKNPATGELIPVWISDYVLGGYGTGAIMAVPAHDERDLAFANSFGLPVKYVVAPSHVDHRNPPRVGKPTVKRNTIHALVVNPKTGKVLGLKWKEFPWTTFIVGGVEEGEDPIEAAKREIAEETGYTDVMFVRRYGGPVQAAYFAAHKDENRLAMAHGLVFELQSEARQNVSDEEAKKHEPVWLDRGELTAEKMNTSELDYWLQALDGREVCFDGEGVAVHSGFLNGLSTADAKEKMIDWLYQNQTGQAMKTYRLRDWVFSRQRYWGEPIPIIICPTCGFVPDEKLPVVLPEVEKYEPTDTGESPLAAIRSWVEVECPKCHGKAERETDTMPNWAGSSWYFLRYCDPHNDQEFADREKLKFWLPIDLYNGGMEHTTLHLLYSRFWYKFLWDLDLVPRECGSEPYARRRSHALILGEGGIKMSKSKGNVVNPDDIVAQYGADVFRVYEMFIGPFDADAPWDTNGIEGVKRFLEKVWRMFEAAPSKDAKLSDEAETLLNQTVKKVGDDIEAMRFNTAVSAMMILANALSETEAIPMAAAESFLKILAPFAPHLAEQLWHSSLGHEESIHVSGWPTVDASKLSSATFELVIQVNGKVRDRVTVDANISEEEAKALALNSEKVQAQLAGKEPQKIVYVKGRLVSISV
jgi:leucyl-tRNA synthetase